MTVKVCEYRGSIKPVTPGFEPEREKERLELLGVEVGDFNKKAKLFEDCVVPTDVHANVTMHSGRFEFDLEFIEEEVEDEPAPPDDDDDDTE